MLNYYLSPCTIFLKFDNFLNKKLLSVRWCQCHSWRKLLSRKLNNHEVNLKKKLVTDRK